jgi:hypothetical protein
VCEGNIFRTKYKNNYGGKKIFSLRFGGGHLNDPLELGSDILNGDRRPPQKLFFQSREQVVVRRGQIRRIGWVIKKLEAQVGQFLLGCKCPVSLSFPVGLMTYQHPCTE